MPLKLAKECLLLAALIAASALTAAAQGSSIPTAKMGGGLDWNESFEGSTGSSGQEMEINSSATPTISGASAWEREFPSI